LICFTAQTENFIKQTVFLTFYYGRITQKSKIDRKINSIFFACKKYGDITFRKGSKIWGKTEDKMKIEGKTEGKIEDKMETEGKIEDKTEDKTEDKVEIEEKIEGSVKEKVKGKVKGKMEDKMKDKIEEAVDMAKGLVVTARNMAQITTLKGRISTCEQVLEKNYRELGRLYYEQYGEESAEEFKKQLRAIRAAQKAIEELEQQIEDIRK